MFCITERRSKKGFTLIELMVAVAIVVVIVTLAVPVYSGLRIRAKVSECINSATPTRLAISEYRQTHGEWPPSLEVAWEPDSGASPYCNTINNYQKATGAFTIDVNEPAVDLRLVNVSPKLVPTISRAEVINWNCSSGETNLEEFIYLPASCRDD